MTIYKKMKLIDAAETLADFWGCKPADIVRSAGDISEEKRKEWKSWCGAIKPEDAIVRIKGNAENIGYISDDLLSKTFTAGTDEFRHLILGDDVIISVVKR